MVCGTEAPLDVFNGVAVRGISLPGISYTGGIVVALLSRYRGLSGISGCILVSVGAVPIRASQFSLRRAPTYCPASPPSCRWLPFTCRLIDV